MRVLVLEASTASAKAMLYDSEAGIIKTESKTYPKEVCDIVTQDADGMVAAVLEAGRACAQGEKVEAVGLSGIWHSLLVCGSDFTPKSKILTWAYLGAADQAAAVRKDKALSSGIYNKTGCAVNALYPLYKAMLLKEQGGFSKTDRLMAQGDYIFYKLTGEFLTSDCLASGSALLELKEKQYDPQLLSMCGIEQGQLPEIGDYRSTRPLSAFAAQALGLCAGIPVVPAHSDGALNQVGAGGLKKGVMTFSVGTSGAIRMVAEKPVTPENGGTWCYIAPGTYLAGAATQGSSNCVDWFMDSVICRTKTYREIEDAIEIKADNPYFLPFIFGERCPGWHDRRRGGFFEVAPHHKAEELYYAILEGVLFNLYQCYGILTKAAGEPYDIKLSGGVLKSKIWTRMLLDIWQRPMTVADTDQASMLGAAALALHAGGGLEDIRQFGDKGEKQLVQEPSQAEFYKKRFEKYMEAYNLNI